jgi:K+-transporting ATPase KdpF subunit
MNATILFIIREASINTGYIIAAVVSLAVLGYLLYSLVKPEKF